MKEPQGSNDTGFIIGAGGASSSTYFSDYASFGSSFEEESVSIFGGCFCEDDGAGVFTLYASFSYEYSDYDVGGRLMYL